MGSQRVCHWLSVFHFHFHLPFHSRKVPVCVLHGLSEVPEEGWVITCSLVFRFPDFLSSFFICFLASPKSSCQSLLLELKLKWCLLSSCYVEHLFTNSQWHSCWWSIDWEASSNSPLHRRSSKNIFLSSIESPIGELSDSTIGQKSNRILTGKNQHVSTVAFFFGASRGYSVSLSFLVCETVHICHLCLYRCIFDVACYGEVSSMSSYPAILIPLLFTIDFYSCIKITDNSDFSEIGGNW